MQEYYNTRDILLPDGMAIYYASRVLGCATPEITNAIFLLHELLRRANERGHRVFFLGTTPHLLKRAIDRLRRSYPAVNIVGQHDGFFALHEEANLVAEINAARADILVIGMSSLQKDSFLQRNADRLEVPVCLGVGGGLDVAAGQYRMAPRWVRRLGLEWTVRLAQEPRRMWRRYATTNSRFVWLLVCELFRRARR